MLRILEIIIGKLVRQPCMARSSVGMILIMKNCRSGLEKSDGGYRLHGKTGGCPGHEIVLEE